MTPIIENQSIRRKKFLGQSGWRIKQYDYIDDIKAILFSIGRIIVFSKSLGGRFFSQMKEECLKKTPLFPVTFTHRSMLLISVFMLSCFYSVLSQELKVRVVDVGAGLCTIIKTPDDRYIIYDAGNYEDHGKSAWNAITEEIPEGAEIDLLVISHSDADHIAAADDIVNNYNVRRILRTGYSKKYVYSNEDHSANFKNLDSAIDRRISEGLECTNLYKEDSIIFPGTEILVGEAQLIFLCGFNQPINEWNLSDPSHKLNSVSIVMKLNYKGHSILFCGDAVGRHINDRSNALIATERYLVEEVNPELINSDVVIAPHHGADNGSSKRFIKATSPEYLIFSSGAKYNHPTKQTVSRYFKYSEIAEGNIFRTDRGEGWLYTDEDLKRYKKKKIIMQWNGQAIENCNDEKADDDVIITIDNNGGLDVKYINDDSCAVN